MWLILTGLLSSYAHQLRPEVINFQSFLYRFSIHEMPLFGDVLGPNSPKYCQVLLNFSPQVVFKEKKNSALRIFENSFFYRNGRSPEFTLLVQLWSLFPPAEDGQILNKIIFKEKIHPLGYPKIVKSRRVSSPLQL